MIAGRFRVQRNLTDPNLLTYSKNEDWELPDGSETTHIL